MSDNDYWDRCIIESWEELLEYCVVIALAMDETHFAEDYKKKFNGAVPVCRAGTHGPGKGPRQWRVKQKRQRYGCRSMT